MAIVHDVYPDEKYCSKHPKYDVRRRPTSACKSCWILWDRKQEKKLKALTTEIESIRSHLQSVQRFMKGGMWW